jgi:hypothetical protein
LPIFEYEKNRNIKKLITSASVNALIITILLSYAVVPFYFTKKIINKPYLPEEKQNEIIEWIKDENNETELKNKLKIVLADNIYINRGEITDKIDYKPDEIIKKLRSSRLELIDANNKTLRIIKFYIVNVIVSLVLGVLAILIKKQPNNSLKHDARAR